MLGETMQRQGVDDGTERGARAVRRLVGAVRAEHSLPQGFYTDPDIFERDLDRMLLRHWICAGHVSQVANPGDFLQVEIGRESVIITRDRVGGLNALVNVCRHRGSRVCLDHAGNASALVCPYHAWTYDLDGTLRGARDAGIGLDRTTLSLKRLPLVVAEGLVFFTFADPPLGFEDAAEILRDNYGLYQWAGAKVAHRAMFSVDANWKLAVENYYECYHCGPAHQEYAELHALARPERDRAAEDAGLAARDEACGINIRETRRFGLAARAGQESIAIYRSPLNQGVVTGSADGAPLAPLMGGLNAYDGATTYCEIGPLSMFLAYADHGLIYRFIPRAVNRTDMEVLWLVRADAEAGREYDRDRLIWLWTVTSEADKRIIEMNQRGVASRGYEPGPYMPMEYQTQAFAEWYLAEIAAP